MKQYTMTKSSKKNNDTILLVWDADLVDARRIHELRPSWRPIHTPIATQSRG